jgi:hypothetical protein
LLPKDENRKDTQEVLKDAKYPVLHVIGKADKFIELIDALSVVSSPKGRTF